MPVVSRKAVYTQIHLHAARYFRVSLVVTNTLDGQPAEVCGKGEKTATRKHAVFCSLLALYIFIYLLTITSVRHAVILRPVHKQFPLSSTINFIRIALSLTSFRTLFVPLGRCLSSFLILSRYFPLSCIPSTLNYKFTNAL
jgi:hypothetical protein